MLGDSKAFSGFAVDDLARARDFYEDVLGLRTTTIDADNGLMTLNLAGQRDVFVYRKEGFVPATYTVLNFQVDDVEATVDGLAARGVEFDRYEGMDQDEKGIARGEGPRIAWFRDPAGNILSVLEQG